MLTNNNTCVYDAKKSIIVVKENYLFHILVTLRNNEDNELPKSNSFFLELERNGKRDNLIFVAVVLIWLTNKNICLPFIRIASTGPHMQTQRNKITSRELNSQRPPTNTAAQVWNMNFITVNMQTNQQHIVRSNSIWTYCLLLFLPSIFVHKTYSKSIENVLELKCKFMRRLLYRAHWPWFYIYTAQNSCYIQSV